MVRRHVGLVQPYVLRVEVSCFSSFHPKPILRRWLGGYHLGRYGCRHNASPLRGCRSCARGKPEVAVNLRKKAFRKTVFRMQGQTQDPLKKN